MFKKWQFATALVMGMTSAAHAEEHMVVMTGFSYFPDVIYAKPGDQVRFVNRSGEDQIVVGREMDWTVGPLANDGDGVLQVSQSTELAFFAAYEDGGDGDDDDAYGNYEDAPIKATITFAPPP